VEGPTNLIVVRRDNLPPGTGIMWLDGPDPATVIMVWPASEITERGARLLEELYRQRRQREAAKEEGGEQRTG
jgi:hypothetical protein